MRLETDCDTHLCLAWIDLEPWQRAEPATDTRQRARIFQDVTLAICNRMRRTDHARVLQLREAVEEDQTVTW